MSAAMTMISGYGTAHRQRKKQKEPEIFGLVTSCDAPVLVVFDS
jgi:hypothetical protein